MAGGTKHRGKNFRISFDDGGTQKVLGMAMEAQYSTERSFLSASHKDSANYLEQEADTTSYNLTGSALLAWDPEATQVNFTFLKTAFDAGTKLAWEMQNSAGSVLSGTGILSTLEISANNEEWVSHNWQMLGDGPDSLDAIP